MAKRMGKFMWKDWAKAHPSMAYQLGALADRINAHPIVTGANRTICFDFELKGA